MFDEVQIPAILQQLFGNYAIKYFQQHSKSRLNTDGLVQDCSNSIANALELLQSCIKPSILAFLQISKP